MHFRTRDSQPRRLAALASASFQHSPTLPVHTPTPTHSPTPTPTHSPTVHSPSPAPRFADLPHSFLRSVALASPANAASLAATSSRARLAASFAARRHDETSGLAHALTLLRAAKAMAAEFPDQTRMCAAGRAVAPSAVCGAGPGGGAGITDSHPSTARGAKETVDVSAIVVDGHRAVVVLEAARARMSTGASATVDFRARELAVRRRSKGLSDLMRRLAQRIEYRVVESHPWVAVSFKDRFA